MASFTDRVLLELGAAAGLGAALAPADDPDRQLVRTLLAATYDLSTARIDTVRSAVVSSVTAARPLVPVAKRTGLWTQTVPSYLRAEVTLDVPLPTEPVWVDLLARLDVTVAAEVDPGGAEAVLTRAVEGFATLDEFRARFTFIDLDAFLAEHGISTVEELRVAFQYLITEIRLRAPGPFDRDDPANAHTLPVTLAVLAVDPVDLTAGLRAARLVTEAVRDSAGAPALTAPIEQTAAYATAVVFDAGGLDAAGLAATAVQQLFAREGVVSLFLPAA
jgi:hypothetical protein